MCKFCDQGHGPTIDQTGCVACEGNNHLTFGVCPVGVCLPPPADDTAEFITINGGEAADCDESSGWVLPVILLVVTVLVAVAIVVTVKQRHSKQLGALRQQQQEQQLDTKATTEVIESKEAKETAEAAMALQAKDDEIAQLKERLASFEGEPKAALPRARVTARLVTRPTKPWPPVEGAP
jgi:hypothetical protein